MRNICLERASKSHAHLASHCRECDDQVIAGRALLVLLVEF